MPRDRHLDRVTRGTSTRCNDAAVMPEKAAEAGNRFETATSVDSVTSDVPADVGSPCNPHPAGPLKVPSLKTRLARFDDGERTSHQGFRHKRFTTHRTRMSWRTARHNPAC